MLLARLFYLAATHIVLLYYESRQSTHCFRQDLPPVSCDCNRSYTHWTLRPIQRIPYRNEKRFVWAIVKNDSPSSTRKEDEVYSNSHAMQALSVNYETSIHSLRGELIIPLARILHTIHRIVGLPEQLVEVRPARSIIGGDHDTDARADMHSTRFDVEVPYRVDNFLRDRTAIVWFPNSRQENHELIATLSLQLTLCV